MPFDGGPKQLPPGLDPVSAGRWGIWLWGQRSRAKAQKRKWIPSRVEGIGLCHRLVTTLLPWRIEEYPGYVRALGALLNIADKTVLDYLYRPYKLPRKHALTLAELCRQRAETFAALEREFREWAERPRERKVMSKRRGG